MNDRHPPAEWTVSHWFNTEHPPSLAALRGRVIVLHAFQMLCPACVAHAVPQAERVHRLFPSEHVAVIGLHTVFEHHDAMTPVALRAFLLEYRITHPVGVDKPVPGDRQPETMRAYGLQGTPSLLLFDRAGSLHSLSFGRVDDLQLGAEIMRLVDRPA